ncbi:hypothetical protein GCM10010129_70220 [Streptomyces fumigatiscleroticus]|nr:hypothetical protein GCM10010129_70220 [Streptomyces fumigatiscleroticus]
MLDDITLYWLTGTGASSAMVTPPPSNSPEQPRIFVEELRAYARRGPAGCARRTVLPRRTRRTPAGVRRSEP